MDPVYFPNILVVDDYESSVEFIQALLKPLDVNIITAFSGGEAIQKTKNKDLALALIDIQMPVMSGPELATILKEDLSRDIFPILFITAYPKDEIYMEKCFQTGIIDYIIKPFNKQILLNKVSIFLEMDRQKRKIRESEAMYRTLMNASPEGIVVMNQQGIILEVSDAILRICGATMKSEFIGKPVLEACRVNDHERFRKLFHKTLDEGLVENEEFKLENQEQSTCVICELSIAKVGDKKENQGMMMLIIRDVSHRKMLEQQLIYKDRLAGLGEMAAGIAHEINQPMNIISMSVDNLLMEIQSNKHLDQEYLERKSEKIFENILRMRKVIDHIRAFSQDQQEDRKTFFDLNESIDNAIMMVSEQMKQHEVSLTLSLSKKIPVIYGNSYKFEQVMLNFIHNALDAVNEKTLHSGYEFRKQIGISTSLEKKNILIEVTDNGIGIKPDDIPKITIPFFSTKSSGKGMGIGLSISHDIIKEFNGTMEITSSYNQKTTVIITIPVASV